PLQADPGEHTLGPAGRDLIRRHLDDEAGVREGEPAARRRPSVDDDLVRARRRRADHAARAHAEGEDAAPVDLLDEGVRRRREPARSRRATVLDPVDQRLRMLDADADRERLRLEREAAALEEREDVARRMPGGEDHAASVDTIAGGGDD